VARTDWAAEGGPTLTTRWLAPEFSARQRGRRVSPLPSGYLRVPTIRDLRTLARAARAGWAADAALTIPDPSKNEEEERLIDITRRRLAAAGALLLAGCASAPDRRAAAAELSPTGRLRAAINFGNPILASRGPQGEPQGVSVDLAREAARRLELPIELVTFNSAGTVVDAIKAKQVDMAFVAIDPVRAADMEYTAPYVIIEGAYLVRQNSPLQRNEEVDRPGTRVAVGRGSAYDLFLDRSLKAATLVRAPTSPAVTDLFLEQNLEVAAGVKQQLEADARRVGGVRLLPGRFMVIEQAMGVPKGRTAAQAWLSAFIEEMKASGFVAEALRRHRIEGAAVAPRAG
jgi:polar amino acid transport system substrate-binding protein